jgi:L-threonylcarbamoyladenylate synthase
VLSAEQVAGFAAAIARGGVGIFGADTVYGLACDPESAAAVRRIYELKGRPPAKPAAVIWFASAALERDLPELGERTAAALRSLLPGPFTLLVPNPQRRFPLACGPDPETLGVRVPALDPQRAALAAIERPLLQTSANLAGGREARELAEVPAAIRAGADAELDAGRLAGTASTVLDLRRYELDGAWKVLRAGVVAKSEIAAALGG